MYFILDDLAGLHFPAVSVSVYDIFKNNVIFQHKTQELLLQHCLHSLLAKWGADKPPHVPNGQNLTDNKILQKNNHYKTDQN